MGIFFSLEITPFPNTLFTVVHSRRSKATRQANTPVTETSVELLAKLWSPFQKTGDKHFVDSYGAAAYTCKVTAHPC